MKQTERLCLCVSGSDPPRSNVLRNKKEEEEEDVYLSIWMERDATSNRNVHMNIHMIRVLVCGQLN